MTNEPTDEEIEDMAHEYDLKHDAHKENKILVTMSLYDKRVHENGINWYSGLDLKASIKRIKEAIPEHITDNIKYQVGKIIDEEFGAELND